MDLDAREHDTDGDEGFLKAHTPPQEDEHHGAEHGVGHCGGEAGGQLRDAAARQGGEGHHPVRHRRLVGELVGVDLRQGPVAGFKHGDGHGGFARLAFGGKVAGGDPGQDGDEAKHDDRRHRLLQIEVLKGGGAHRVRDD